MLLAFILNIDFQPLSGVDMKTKKCPTCGGKIKIYYDHGTGDEVYCEDCEREFLLVSMIPLRLEPLEQYDDYYFDDEDY